MLLYYLFPWSLIDYEKEQLPTPLYLSLSQILPWFPTAVPFSLEWSDPYQALLTSLFPSLTFSSHIGHQLFEHFMFLPSLGLRICFSFSAVLHFLSPPPFYLISVDLPFGSHLRPHFLRTSSWSQAPLSCVPIEFIPFFQSMISICDYTVTSLINVSSSIRLWTPWGHAPSLLCSSLCPTTTCSNRYMVNIC